MVGCGGFWERFGPAPANPDRDRPTVHWSFSQAQGEVGLRATAPTCRSPEVSQAASPHDLEQADRSYRSVALAAGEAAPAPPSPRSDGRRVSSANVGWLFGGLGTNDDWHGEGARAPLVARPDGTPAERGATPSYSLTERMGEVPTRSLPHVAALGAWQRLLRRPNRMVAKPHPLNRLRDFQRPGNARGPSPPDSRSPKPCIWATSFVVPRYVPTCPDRSPLGSCRVTG